MSPEDIQKIKNYAYLPNGGFSWFDALCLIPWVILSIPGVIFLSVFQFFGSSSLDEMILRSYTYSYRDKLRELSSVTRIDGRGLYAATLVTIQSAMIIYLLWFA